MPKGSRRRGRELPTQSRNSPDQRLDTRPKKRPDKRRERAAEAFKAKDARLRRARTIVGFLGLVPLLGSQSCESGFVITCAVPRELYLAMWAAIFGAFIGLSIRLVLERRRFEHRTPAS